MRKSRMPALLLMLLLFFSCSEQQQHTFTIEGNTGTPKGELCLFGTDSRCDTTISAECDEEGFFSITIPAKAVTPLALITPDKQYVPIYGEPGITARLQKDSTLPTGWSITGGETQTLHDSITRVLDNCTNTDKLTTKIDSFILQNPINLVNIEIIRRYLTETPQADNKAIRTRISKLGGILQDHGYFVELKEKTDNKISNIKHRSLPSFTYTTADSTEITHSSYIKKYTLITFWASWDSCSRKRMKMLTNIQDSIKSNSFALLNISLDYDSAAWRKFLTEDSIAGDNAMDNKMFSSPLVNQFNIGTLPFTMLVSPYQRVQEYDVKMEGIVAHIDSLTRKYDKSQEKNTKKANKKK